MNRRPLLLSTFAALAFAAGPARAQGLPELPAAKPVPVVQVLPLPDDQTSFTVGGREVARYWFAPRQERPFVYPIIGASGRSLTRMGHPRDPVGHGHHNSFWVAHQSVDGENYWEDPGAPRIVPRKILRYDDGDAEAAITSDNDWVGADGRVHMTDRRRMTVRPMKDGEWLLTLDLQFRAPDTPVNPGGSVVLGDTAFGPVAVRMAKTIGVADGGGRLRNSEGNEDEQGPNGCFRKPARWVDYSGPIVEGVAEGITLLDHPANPSHPSPFHVRRDGWMGAALTFGGARTIEPGKPLLLRYALYVHRGVPTPQTIDAVWTEFAKGRVEPLPAK
ncbi:DUF6807 domain-containing protein [Paludisphaera rhizosphaerae]|uniref:DUF6807 domain-containing protein n=1 Tax=Paludisphaera rhizosphaerae TaxID=2711216 RepID=UPI0013EB21BE|nr:PmoA family protein [Paludisphaera rhizosphaerae]